MIQMNSGPVPGISQLGKNSACQEVGFYHKVAHPMEIPQCFVLIFEKLNRKKKIVRLSNA